MAAHGPPSTCPAATIAGMEHGPDRPRPGPVIDPNGQEVVFRLEADPHWTPVRVWYHLRTDGADPSFRWEAGQWVARIPRPPVDRLEYLLVARGPDGGMAMVPDPANPHRVGGVFGDKSVVEFPGYRPPWWVQGDDDRTGSAAGAGSRPRGSGLVPMAVPTVRHPDPPVPPAISTEGVRSVRGARRHGGDERALRLPLATSPRAGALVADSNIEPPDVVDPAADVVVTGRLHVPAGSTPDEPMPLLVVHDGPEYAGLCSLERYLAALARADARLRCRVLLLAPHDRDRSYSASPAYARALATGMLPQVLGTVATRGPVVGMGASLGGLAMLHAAVRHPGAIGAVFSQSGSFFQPGTDDMERGYRFFARIARFVEDVDAEPARLVGLDVAMTCGTGEDNLANNRALARRLSRAGVPVHLVENPDGHNHIGWRDSLDPALRLLLTRAWTAPA